MSLSVDRELAIQALAALPTPIMLVGDDQQILFANPAAEQFFATGAAQLVRQKLGDLLSFGSPVLALISHALGRNASVGEHEMQLSTPRLGERVVDVSVTPVPAFEGAVLVTFQDRGVALRLDRQLLHRSAVRSLHGMAAVLAHEIKNPLAGIKGAAQLLESSLDDSDRQLTRLIYQESDRISTLIDRMEELGDARCMPRLPVNIHEVLAYVRKVAETGFARHVTFSEAFDPSLPVVAGDRDQLIQVFLNLVRNASDAVSANGGQIILATGYRPGMRMRAGNSSIGLPLEVTVRDDGPGIAADLLPYVFDPFVTTKPRGSGLGLALVTKIVGDHGGVVECESAPRRTVFRVLLPTAEDSIP